MPGDSTEVPSVRLVRELRHSGSSTVLTVPPDVLRVLGCQQGDKVVIEADGEVMRVFPEDDEEGRDGDG